MQNELGGIFKKAFQLMKIPPLYFLGGTEKSHEIDHPG
jgi:hypothetical protein